MSFSRRITGIWLVILPLLLPGLLVASWRCFFRHVAEQKNTFVETVIDFEELRQLSREEGWTLDELFSEVKKSGASSVAISEDTLTSLESEGRITVLSFQEIQKLSMEEDLKAVIPNGMATMGALWIHSQDSSILDRIEQQLSWKLAAKHLFRIHRNFLLINKSSDDFKSRVGLGFSEPYFEKARAHGLGIVVRVFNYPGLTASSAERIVNSLPAPASISALLFAEEEMLGNRGDLKGIIELFRNRSYRIGWIEFNTQEGIGSYLKGLSSSRPFVRVHSISRKELDQIYNVKRAVARWTRAVRDRSMKMLYIRCFFQDEKRFIADLVRYNLDYLKKTTDELRRWNYSIAESESQRLFEPRHIMGKMSFPEKLAMGIALMLGLPWLIMLAFQIRSSDRYFIGTAFGTIFMFLVVPENLFVSITGLVGAITYASIGVISAVSFLDEKKSFGLREYVVFFARLVFPAILGGILIAGIYSEVEFLLKYKQFRGIKLAFLLPLLISGLWAIRRFGKGFLRFFSKPLNPISSLIAITMLGGIAIYILRSGNVTFIKPSAIEDQFRTFLEDTLIARPRNKEFLIGYPACFLIIFFYFRRLYSIIPVLIVFLQMGMVSVVNTFCHFHSPLFLTLLRVFNGLWTGIAVGIIVLALFRISRLIYYLGVEKGNSVMLVGYFGFGNLGDELLHSIFSRRILEVFPKMKIAVLNQGQRQSNDCEQVEFVSRKDPFGVLEEVFKAKSIIIPGGGVLQSKTSLKSLVYYLSLITVGRLAGAKILLPSQGMGPWGDLLLEKNQWLKRWLLKELKSAEILTVRDSESLRQLEAISENLAENIAVASDLVFLNNESVQTKVKDEIESLRVAAILRGDTEESPFIAKSLVEMSEEIENLDLHPIAFQTSEDVKSWDNSGFDGEVEVVNSGNCLSRLKDFDLIISGRLHGCILAESLFIPWIGIDYDPKVDGFAKEAKWKYCFKPEKFDRQFLEKKIEEIALKREKLLELLARERKYFFGKAEESLDQVIRSIQ